MGLAGTWTGGRPRGSGRENHSHSSERNGFGHLQDQKRVLRPAKPQLVEGVGAWAEASPQSKERGQGYGGPLTFYLSSGPVLHLLCIDPN